MVFIFTQTQCAERFASAKDWLTYMYGTTQGFITRASIQNNYRQWHYDRTSLAVQQYDACENVYVSMNTFYKTYRQREFLKKLNALYIDIDCYKENLTKEQALTKLRGGIIGKKIPEPTFIVDSGRGLYLIWKIAEDVKALPRWERVMKHLYRHTKDLGADASAAEPCRILRVPFTVNRASGTSVKILSFYNHTYTLYEIIKNFDVTEYKETAVRRAKPADKPSVPAVMTGPQRALLQGRINDLEKLYKNRRGPDCRRENALFLIRHWYYRLTGDRDYALCKTLEFNARLDVPHDERYVITRTESAVKKNGAYRFSNGKLIEFLDIKAEEAAKLTRIKRADKEAQKLKKRESNRKNYLSRLAARGASTKREAVKTRRTALMELVAEGKSRSEICAALGISVSTYKRDMAAGSKTQPPYYKEQRSCSGSPRPHREDLPISSRPHREDSLPRTWRSPTKVLFASFLTRKRSPHREDLPISSRPHREDSLPRTWRSPTKVLFASFSYKKKKTRPRASPKGDLTWQKSRVIMGKGRGVRVGIVKKGRVYKRQRRLR